jgi:phosphatidylglycerol:prolipoprotein diacylglycerol transferase
MNPGLQIGPLHIYYYGLILGVAIVVGYLFARRRALTRGVSPDFMDLCFVTMVPAAIIGARLYYVAFSFEVYRNDLTRIFSLSQGGLAFHGALIGGFIGVLIALALAHRKKIKTRLSALLDVVAPVLLLSQAIGRLANYVNQEAFGGPTDLPWGIVIAPERRPAGLEAQTTFHPTFAYEALWNLVGLGLLLLIERNWRKKGYASRGSLFALYLIWYSIARFWIEFLRTDALLVGGLRVAQIISIVAFLGSAFYLWYAWRQWSRKSAPHKAA